MKRLFLCLTLILIAFAINADYHDPNHQFDYDQYTVGYHYASAYASERIDGPNYIYFASASGSYSSDALDDPDLHLGNNGAYWSLSVEATPMESDSDSGVRFPGGSTYMSISGIQMWTPSYAQSYSSMGAACVYAGM